MSEIDRFEGIMASEMLENNRTEGIMASETDKPGGDIRFVLERANGRSVKDASNAAGFSTRTGYRRLKKPDWHNAIQETRALMIELAVDFVSSNLLDTLNTVTVIKDEGDSDSVKLGAAKIILQMAMAQIKLVEVNDWDESPVKQEKKLDFSALTEEELRLFLALMAKLEGENEAEY